MVKFSRNALEHILGLGAEIVGVCTLQDSKFNTDHVDLSGVSAAHGIPWRYADDINSAEIVHWIRDTAPDVIFCFGWSRLLGVDLLKLAPLGVVGFHPAALPANRGRHPLIWALALGLPKTASSFFFMDTCADSGDILSQREVIIEDDDDARSLYDKVTASALSQIEEFMPQLASQSYARQPQVAQFANTWRKRSTVDGQIDWRMSARSIHNLVRGLTKPYVGAHFVTDGKVFKVWKSEIWRGSQKNVEPGKVLMQSGSSTVVKCGENAICLLVTEPAFKPLVGSYL